MGEKALDDLSEDALNKPFLQLAFGNGQSVAAEASSEVLPSADGGCQQQRLGPRVYHG